MTDVCERDAFCDLEPEHHGECRQPFETEYREGAHCLTELGIIAERNRRHFYETLESFAIDPSTVTQADLFVGTTGFNEDDIPFWCPTE